jgi:hypothetical protein
LGCCGRGLHRRNRCNEEWKYHSPPFSKGDWV